MPVVAIYACVSTSEQSPEPQLRELREYAARRGFAVHREYVDQASGDMSPRLGKPPPPLPFELPDRLKPPRSEAPAAAAV